MSIEDLQKQNAELEAAMHSIIDNWTAQFERQGHMAPDWVKRARAVLDANKQPIPLGISAYVAADGTTKSSYRPAAANAGNHAPAGYAIVPLEPTGVMKDCGANALPLGAGNTWTAADCYRAMLAAAPRTGAADAGNQPSALGVHLMREAAFVLQNSMFQFCDTGDKAVDLARRIYAAIAAHDADTNAGNQPVKQSPYEEITLANLRAGKLSAGRVYVGYCEISEELKAANGAIKRYQAENEKLRQAAVGAGALSDGQIIAAYNVNGLDVVRTCRALLAAQKGGE